MVPILKCPEMWQFIVLAGDPRPTVRWERVGAGLPTSAVVRDRRIVIQSVGPDDGATYRCVASNIIGTVFDQVELLVEGESIERTCGRSHMHSKNM